MLAIQYIVLSIYALMHVWVFVCLLACTRARIAKGLSCLFLFHLFPPLALLQSPHELYLLVIFMFLGVLHDQTPSFTLLLSLWEKIKALEQMLISTCVYVCDVRGRLPVS